LFSVGPIEQFFSHIMTRSDYFMMRWWWYRFCARP